MDVTLNNALADPITHARIGSMLDDFRARSVAPLPVKVIAFATDAGPPPEAASILAEAVEELLRQIGEQAA